LADEKEAMVAAQDAIVLENTDLITMAETQIELMIE
jgi:hypothetical protein